MLKDYFIISVIFYDFFHVGFLPDTNLEIAIADGIVDQIQDCILKVIKMWFTKDPDEKVNEVILSTFKIVLRSFVIVSDAMLHCNRFQSCSPAACVTYTYKYIHLQHKQLRVVNY